MSDLGGLVVAMDEENISGVMSPPQLQMMGRDRFGY